MKNDKETTSQNIVPPKMLSGKYSDVMAWTASILGLENPLTKEQPTKAPQTKRDNTIRVTFLKRSKNQPKK